MSDTKKTQVLQLSLHQNDREGIHLLDPNGVIVAEWLEPEYAEVICRAVNNHGRLLEALKDLIDYNSKTVASQKILNAKAAIKACS